MKERYQDTFIALPIGESPMLRWVETFNSHKKFYHMTLYFLSTINEEFLKGAGEIIKKNSEILKGLVLIPEGLGFIGPNLSTHVLRIKETGSLLEFRKIMEREFAQYNDINLPFIPHITLSSSRNVQQVNSREGNYKLPDPYTPGSIGIFYKTEEGATALLFVQKIK